MVNEIVFKLFQSDVGLLTSSYSLTLKYYKSKKTGEIDFIFEFNAAVVPFEVKSGSDYKKHKALDNLLIGEENIVKAVVTSVYNLEKKDRILYLPVYMIGLEFYV